MKKFSEPMIRHLFISPGHNYFGRHGKSAGEYSLKEVASVECVAGSGLRGDRFFDYKPDYKGQITFFAWENLHAMWEHLDVPPDSRDTGATRRNVITENLDLSELIGQEFELQGVRFQGVEECRPCYWMNGAIHPEAEAWMRGRGGLRARILSDGVLKSANPKFASVPGPAEGSSRSSRLKELISVEEAGQRLRKLVKDALVTECPLDACAGRVLRGAVTADRDLPPFDRVMLDGFAVAWSEGISTAIQKPRFEIVGQSFAGSPVATLPPHPLLAMEIMTGSPLPSGADTIIPIEDVDLQEDGSFTVKTTAKVERGQGVHDRGSDFAKGEVLLQPGTVLGPVEIGIAASCGFSRLPVSRLPRITVIGTGDELVPYDTEPQPWQIRRSNAISIATALKLAGFPVETLLHLSDNREEETSRLAEAVQVSDIVILSGAVSMGARDWIPDALSQMAECVFHGVAQRPGKPMGVWHASPQTVIFGLPGNPVSTLVSVHRHVLPYLRRCSANSQAEEGAEVVTLSRDFEMKSPLTVFLPVTRESNGFVTPAPTRNSGDYAHLAGSAGFIELDATRTAWKAGETLPFYSWQS